MTPTTSAGPATAMGTCEPDVRIDDTKAVRAAGSRDDPSDVSGRRLRQHDQQFELGAGATGHIKRANDAGPSAVEHIDHAEPESGGCDDRPGNRPGRVVA